MKILDVDLLQDGLKRNKAMLERLRNETENIERTVSGLVEMDELLKGAGGNAIRDFYAECHLPFLQFFQLFSVTYLQTLEQMESALQSLEPDPAGYIRQEFLEGELEQGLTLIGNLTEALTNEANSIMDSVSDIVALPHLDDSAVQEGVITSKKKRDDTVQKLNEFDYSQTVSLNPVEQDIQTMDTWLTDIDGMFQSGLTDVHFQPSRWGILANTLKMELEARTSRIPGDTAIQPNNYDLTTMFSTFLIGASPLQFGYGGFIRKPTVLYGPSILGFASLPTHSTTKNINENV
ncbi:LXG domain-containing protein, partial [Psychrobacillus sp. BL-248-WT-3]|uniref:ribonuclease YeeF family protein n=1 Tax=Psychrobacillus sp. BL-248-WT-3 TaxID=2725306 RepID=UPI0018521C1A